MPGHRALHERVVRALQTCVESQGVEFKQSAAWKDLESKIIRTALAMANLRDGGVIIVGVSEKDDRWSLEGIADGHLTTYDVDDVADAIHRFASPAVSAMLVLVPYDNRQFLAIEVFEFADTPIVCRRDGTDLRQGAVYVRPTGMAKTTEVRSADQMHDLLQLAAEKRARAMLETARGIGLEAPAARKPFDEELGGL